MLFFNRPPGVRLPRGHRVKGCASLFELCGLYGEDAGEKGKSSRFSGREVARWSSTRQPDLQNRSAIRRRCSWPAAT